MERNRPAISDFTHEPVELSWRLFLGYHFWLYSGLCKFLYEIVNRRVFKCIILLNVEYADNKLTL